MTGPIELERFQRATFLDENRDPTVVGIVLAKELEMGMLLYRVLVEERGDNVVAESDGSDALGEQLFWDYQIYEASDFVTLDELLLHDKENV